MQKSFFNTKFILQYTVFLALFLVVFIFSTQWIMAFRGLLVNETDAIEFGRINNDITSEIYYSTISSNIDGAMEVAGYAYMETSDPNPEKRIDLLLVSDEYTFRVPTTLSVRHDLSAERTGKMIQGTNHSFSGKFSYFQIPDGVYQLVLFCYENESTQGYKNLVQYYAKEGRNFRRAVIPSLSSVGERVKVHNGVDLEKVEDIPSEPVPWHYINFSSSDKEYMSFNGWIARVNLESKNAASYLAFTNQDGNTMVFTTISYESTQLEKSVGTPLVNNGFFDAYISLKDFVPGEYTLELIVQYPEGTWKPKVSHKVIIHDDMTVTFQSGL